MQHGGSRSRESIESIEGFLATLRGEALETMCIIRLAPQSETRPERLTVHDKMMKMRREARLSCVRVWAFRVCAGLACLCLVFVLRFAIEQEGLTATLADATTPHATEASLAPGGRSAPASLSLRRRRGTDRPICAGRGGAPLLPGATFEGA